MKTEWQIWICSECGRENNWHTDDCSNRFWAGRWPEFQTSHMIYVDVVKK